ncbi:hypothetical protein [Pedobacter aquatilis]|uniref:hypothetical protein n=1 Tax=Pedobacter aquatilis TaxID=351343 RepID=UPI00292D0915|nr:hypothetical protein [Pedobacter aquatilis]
MNADSQAKFSSVSGLEPNHHAAQKLRFTDGKIFGIAFLRWFAQSRKVVCKEMEVFLWNDETLLYKWKLLDVTLSDYQISDKQATEEYMLFDFVELLVQRVEA